MNSSKNLNKMIKVSLLVAISVVLMYFDFPIIPAFPWLQIDLSEVKQAVIIPGRAFVHQLDAERILSADGVERIVGRGPDTLTIDGELSFDKTDENVIEEELTQFNDLVDAINFFGMRI